MMTSKAATVALYALCLVIMLVGLALSLPRFILTGGDEGYD